MFNNPFGRGSSPPQQPFQVPEALQQPPSPQSTPPQPPPEDKGSSKPNEKTSFQGFDPTGFERAAKAAKELNNSKYVTEAVELAKQAEETKQAEYKAAQRERLYLTNFLRSHVVWRMKDIAAALDERSVSSSCSSTRRPSSWSMSTEPRRSSSTWRSPSSERCLGCTFTTR